MFRILVRKVRGFGINQCLGHSVNADATTNFLSPIASASMIETPDPIVNQGVFWAKVNMLRVMAEYPEGLAFTNDPGVSTNIVGRDIAWFVYGCDHLLPEFSKTMLLKFAQKQYETGKFAGVL